METPTLEQVYLLGQTIAAVAVVISLVYVGIQVRQNTYATRSAARQTISGFNIEWYGMAIDSKILADAILKDSDDGALDKHEEQCLFFWHMMRWRTLENAYYQHHNRLLDDHEWNGYRNIIRLMPSSGKRSLTTWNRIRDRFSPAFNAEVQSIWDKG